MLFSLSYLLKNYFPKLIPTLNSMLFFISSFALIDGTFRMSPFLRVPNESVKDIPRSWTEFLNTKRRTYLLAELPGWQTFSPVSVWQPFYVHIFSLSSGCVHNTNMFQGELLTQEFWFNCLCLPFKFTTSFLSLVACNFHFHIIGSLPVGFNFNIWKRCFHAFQNCSNVLALLTMSSRPNSITREPFFSPSSQSVAKHPSPMCYVQYVIAFS